jgi:hypothetical protein
MLLAQHRRMLAWHEKVALLHSFHCLPVWMSMAVFFAVMTLGNLAADADTRESATKGCSALLVSPLQTAACNMANECRTQARVVVRGGLQPLLVMGTGSDRMNARRGVMSVGNLSANDDNHAGLVSKGVLKNLITLATADETPEMRQYARCSHVPSLIWHPA